MTMIVGLAAPDYALLACDRTLTHLSTPPRYTEGPGKLRRTRDGFGAHSGFCEVGLAAFADPRGVQATDPSLPARLEEHFQSYAAVHAESICSLGSLTGGAPGSTFALIYGRKGRPRLLRVHVPGARVSSEDHLVMLPPGVPRGRGEEIARALQWGCAGVGATTYSAIRATARAFAAAAAETPQTGTVIDLGILVAAGAKRLRPGRLSGIAGEIAALSDREIAKRLRSGAEEGMPQASGPAVHAIRGYNAAGAPGPWFPVTIQKYKPEPPSFARVSSVTAYEDSPGLCSPASPLRNTVTVVFDGVRSGDTYDLLRYEEGRFDETYGAVVVNGAAVPLASDSFTVEHDDEITGYVYDGFGTRYQIFYRAILHPAEGGTNVKDSATMTQERTACP